MVFRAIAAMTDRPWKAEERDGPSHFRRAVLSSSRPPEGRRGAAMPELVSETSDRDLDVAHLHDLLVGLLMRYHQQRAARPA